MTKNSHYSALVHSNSSFCVVAAFLSLMKFFPISFSSDERRKEWNLFAELQQHGAEGRWKWYETFLILANFLHVTNWQSEQKRKSSYVWDVIGEVHKPLVIRRLFCLFIHCSNSIVRPNWWILKKLFFNPPAKTSSLLGLPGPSYVESFSHSQYLIWVNLEKIEREKQGKAGKTDSKSETFPFNNSVAYHEQFSEFSFSLSSTCVCVCPNQLSISHFEV